MRPFDVLGPHNTTGGLVIRDCIPTAAHLFVRRVTLGDMVSGTRRRSRHGPAVTRFRITGSA